MARDRVISGDAGNSGLSDGADDVERPFDRDDAEFDEELRPRQLSQVVGQQKVVERVQVMLDATRKRGDTLGHLLLDGPPGIGENDAGDGDSP